MTERKGKYSQTFSGTKFYPFDPRPEEIHIEDIAHSLAFQCRFNGHVKYFYSVAQHCVIGSKLIDPEFALAFLLHDAAEAYISDIPRPIKESLNSKMLREAEDALQKNIYAKFGVVINPDMQRAIKEVDNRLVITEARALIKNKFHWSLDDHYEPYKYVFQEGSHTLFWSPEFSEKIYLITFETLKNLERKNIK